ADRKPGRNAPTTTTSRIVAAITLPLSSSVSRCTADRPALAAAACQDGPLPGPVPVACGACTRASVIPAVCHMVAQKLATIYDDEWGNERTANVGGQESGRAARYPWHSVIAGSYHQRVNAGEKDSGLRLAELVAAFSRATDLGIGQPMEHVLR